MQNKKSIQVLIARVQSGKNAYARLGIPDASSSEFCHSAFLASARVLHPDRCTVEGAGDAFARLSADDALLADPKTKKKYDLEHKVQCCTRCGGTGSVLKQKGFKGKVAVPCPYCMGGSV